MDLECICFEIVVVVSVVVEVVVFACDGPLTLLSGIVVDGLDVVLRLLVCCTSIVVVVVVAVFLDCGDFWLLYIDLFCFVGCCCVVVVPVEVVCVVLGLDCVGLVA